MCSPMSTTNSVSGSTTATARRPRFTVPLVTANAGASAAP